MSRDVESKGGNGAPSGSQAETEPAGSPRIDNLRLAAVFLDQMVIPAAGTPRHDRLVGELRGEGLVGAETVSLDALRARATIALEEAVQSEQATSGPAGNTPTLG